MIKALITIYNPTKEVPNNIKKIISQVDEVFLCDNSEKDNSLLFKEILNENVHYVFFNKNLGLSKAFNKVLKEMKYNWNNDDYIIFFDQDSNINDNHISLLIDEYNNINTLKKDIGCLGTIYYDMNTKTYQIPKAKQQINKNSYKVKSVITSSMVTTYKNLKKVNFWNEKIFLDYVDWDFCWRLQQSNLSCYITKVSPINHALGDGEKKVGIIKVKVGKPFRIYYQTRDGLYLLKERYVPFKYKVRFILNLTVRPIVHILVLGDKKKRVKYFFKGINDFFSNKNGAIQNK